MAATDRFDRHLPKLESPCSRHELVTPSDADDLAEVSRSLWIGGGGNIAVHMKDTGAVTIMNVPAGSELALRVTRVLATGTTATDIIAFS